MAGDGVREPAGRDRFYQQATQLVQEAIGQLGKGSKAEDRQDQAFIDKEVALLVEARTPVKECLENLEVRSPCRYWKISLANCIVIRRLGWKTTSDHSKSKCDATLLVAKAACPCYSAEDT